MRVFIVHHVPTTVADFEMPRWLDEALEVLMREGKTISAIKLFRGYTQDVAGFTFEGSGFGLKDAKDFIESTYGIHGRK